MVDRRRCPLTAVLTRGAPFDAGSSIDAADAGTVAGPRNGCSTTSTLWCWAIVLLPGVLLRRRRAGSALGDASESGRARVVVHARRIHGALRRAVVAHQRHRVGTLIEVNPKLVAAGPRAGRDDRLPSRSDHHLATLLKLGADLLGRDDLLGVGELATHAV